MHFTPHEADFECPKGHKRPYVSNAPAERRWCVIRTPLGAALLQTYSNENYCTFLAKLTLYWISCWSDFFGTRFFRFATSIERMAESSSDD